MAETGLAIMMWTAAFATRGWVTGYFITQDISAGLFAVEENGIVREIDTSVNPILTTIVLETIGGFFAVVSAGLLAVTVLKPNKSTSLIFMITTFLSGIFIIAGVSYYNVELIQDSLLLDAGYSWYLALFSGIFILSTPGTLGSAIKRGEIPTGTDNVVRLY
ncbi:hypothetical protein Bpfe_016050 [Biomphalaria pfeifferi]|uniref:Uncharacterized protein n=1 Tax=Biomphalaria pfeifferi TaxID=112525 RepID=A0AAD8BIJ9_BIOPF|nr:hypothetical protein Bpfe_016050 [Biomphalaria pfeifferi]